MEAVAKAHPLNRIRWEAARGWKMILAGKWQRFLRCFVNQWLVAKNPSIDYLPLLGFKCHQFWVFSPSWCSFRVSFSINRQSALFCSRSRFLARFFLNSSHNFQFTTWYLYSEKFFFERWNRENYILYLAAKVYPGI